MEQEPKPQHRYADRSHPDYLRPLTAFDYVNMNVNELVKYSDYSQHALRVTLALMKLNSKELEQLDLTKIKGA